MSKRHLVTFTDGTTEDIKAQYRGVEYTSNWVIFTLDEKTTLRLNIDRIHSILIYEEE